MPLKLEDKQAIVTQVAQIAGQAHSAVVAEYRNMNSAAMTQLRVQAREDGVNLRVVRNTLARRAVKNTDFECLGEVLVGPVFLAFSMEEPGAAARVISKFVKSNEKLIVKGLSLGGQFLPATQIDAVAKLPTYSEAVSKLMAVMQAPVTKLVRTLAEPQAKLVRTIAAIKAVKSSE
ncbi:MAG TPA: 50S ribosomal protein L10 [Thioploca sp.]|nr:50S ribosomal protein L10 [Thioploca sp.]